MEVMWRGFYDNVIPPMIFVVGFVLAISLALGVALVGLHLLELFVLWGTNL